MTDFQRGFGESDIGTGGPTIGHRFAADYAFDEPEKITVKDADTKAHRASLCAAPLPALHRVRSLSR